MGSGDYSHAVYVERNETRAKTNAPTFGHDAEVKAGRARGVHPTLDIKGKIRESRDSDGQPSIAIAIVFDVTGSMADVPVVLQKNLSALMRQLVDHGYTGENKPQVLFGAVGDATCDRIPFQIGQFEADNRLEDHMLNMVLEKGGGGSGEESYELVLHYFGDRTSIDCFEKRGHKGYLFMFGDEYPYPTVRRQDLVDIMGVGAQTGIPIEQAVKAAMAKYNVFYIIPAGTSHYHDRGMKDRWDSLLGAEHVIKLADAALASATIGLIIGLNEGTVRSLEEGLNNLSDLNLRDREIVRNAVSTTRAGSSQR